MSYLLLGLRALILVLAVFAYIKMGAIWGWVFLSWYFFSFLLCLRKPLLLEHTKANEKWELLGVCLILGTTLLITFDLNAGFFSQSDTMLHIGGGAFVALWAWLSGFTARLKGDQVKRVIVVLAFAAFAGALWEFGEWIFDATIGMRFGLPSFQPSAADTIKDLLADLLGAAAVVFFLLFQKRRV